MSDKPVRFNWWDFLGSLWTILFLAAMLRGNDDTQQYALIVGMLCLILSKLTDAAR